MIEIVFSDSACGSLKVAQNYDEGKYQSVGIGVIVSHEDGSKLFTAGLFPVDGG